MYIFIFTFPKCHLFANFKQCMIKTISVTNWLSVRVLGFKPPAVSKVRSNHSSTAGIIREHRKASVKFTSMWNCSTCINKIQVQHSGFRRWVGGFLGRKGMINAIPTVRRWYCLDSHTIDQRNKNTTNFLSSPWVFTLIIYRLKITTGTTILELLTQNLS